MWVAKHTRATVSGKTVDYIEADIDTIAVEVLSTPAPNKQYKELVSSNKLGINGTFFDDASLTIAGIAWGSGAAAVGPNGATNASYTRGTIVCFRPNGGTAKVASRFVINKAADLGIPTSWVDWAIGGLSLFIGDSTIQTQSDYDQRTQAEHASSIGGAYPEAADYRSAIGYKSGGKIVLAVIQNAKPWDVRSVMTALGCTDGVMLDGSTASQMRYLDAGGTARTVSFGSRATCSAVTVNGATWQ